MKKITTKAAKQRAYLDRMKNLIVEAVQISSDYIINEANEYGASEDYSAEQTKNLNGLELAANNILFWCERIEQGLVVTRPQPPQKPPAKP